MGGGYITKDQGGAWWLSHDGVGKEMEGENSDPQCVCVCVYTSWAALRIVVWGGFLPFFPLKK